MDKNLPEQNYFAHFAMRYPVVDAIGQGQAGTQVLFIVCQNVDYY